MTFMIVRLVASLAVVVGLMLLLARWSNRRFSGSAGVHLRVVARQGLSRGSSIAVVEAGERVLLVGLTDQQVRLLAELDPDELVASGGVEDVGEVEDPDELEDSQVAPEGAGRHLRTSGRPADADRSPGQGDGALAGSVLSIDTWRQALAAAKRSAS